MKAIKSSKSTKTKSSEIPNGGWDSESVNAIGFLRQSTEKQAKGVGKAVQKKHIMAMAIDEAFQIKTWVYEIESGKADGRKACKKIRELLRTGTYSALFVDDLSRLGRTPKRFNRLLKIAKKYNVAIFSYYEKFDSRREMTPEYKNLLKAYLDCGPRRLAEAKEYMKAMGIRTGGAIRFGLMKQGGVLVPHPQEVETLRMIAAMNRKGLSAPQIAKALRKAGRKTKRGKTKWHPKTVRNYIKLVKQLKKEGAI